MITLRKVNGTSSIRDHSFSTYAKFSEKLTFLTPWYIHVPASVYQWIWLGSFPLGFWLYREKSIHRHFQKPFFEKKTWENKKTLPVVGFFFVIYLNWRPVESILGILSWFEEVLFQESLEILYWFSEREISK